MTEGMTLIGYLRVSTDEQGKSGLGLEAQRRAILRECDHRGWVLLRFEQDVASGRSTNGRAGLSRALDACASGEVQGLITAKLDRLSRSVVDFGRLIERAQKERWDIVVLDPALDLSTPGGRLCAGVLVQVAQWEREIIGERIRAALAVSTKKAGRPRSLDPKIRARIRRLHRAGHGYSEIARRLNAEEVSTAQGGRWHASTVRKILST